MCRFGVFALEQTWKPIRVLLFVVVFENSTKPTVFFVRIHLHPMRAQCVIANQTTNAIHAILFYCSIFGTPLRDTSFGTTDWEGYLGGVWEHLGFMLARVLRRCTVTSVGRPKGQSNTNRIQCAAAQHIDYAATVRHALGKLCN